MGYEAQSILDEIDQVRRGFLFMNSLLGTIGGISLVVAAMMIVNTLVMAVWERTREIGLLKSMGATDGDVMRLFLTEAGVIGIVGGLGGLLLGYVVARITNALAEGINAKIEKIKRMACGYRNRSHYRAAIYFHGGGLDLFPKPPIKPSLSFRSLCTQHVGGTH